MNAPMATPPPLTGLFLGAGASAELGMPLVWELTEELKNWLSPEKLKSFNEGWRVQKGRMSDAVIEDFIPVLVRPEMHYESLLGYLETQFRRTSSLRSGYHHLYSWFVEMVSHLLRLRHLHMAPFITRNLRLLEGITKLAEMNTPLWVFSLNHDMIVECVAAQFGIKVHSGFSDGIVSFPRRNAAGAIIDDLYAETLTAAHLESGIRFPAAGTAGINPLKIHGALDIFTFRNGVDMARLLPQEESTLGIVEMLRIANEELVYLDPRFPPTMKATNEIAYGDHAGVMQFLRRTLLSGAYKFDNRQSQVLPAKILTQFQTNLNHVTKLLCIGYGFGDLHINQIIRSWLEESSERRLEIVGPKSKSVPSSLLHVSPQGHRLTRLQAPIWTGLEASPVANENCWNDG